MKETSERSAFASKRNSGISHDNNDEEIAQVPPPDDGTKFSLNPSVGKRSSSKSFKKENSLRRVRIQRVSKELHQSPSSTSLPAAQIHRHQSMAHTALYAIQPRASEFALLDFVSDQEEVEDEGEEDPLEEECYNEKEHAQGKRIDQAAFRDVGNIEADPLCRPSDYGATTTQSVGSRPQPPPRMLSGATMQKHRARVLRRVKYRFSCSYFHPITVLQFFSLVVVRSYLVCIGLPMLAMSWILFYSAGNPVPEFLPGTVSLAWWCDFVARQTVTLELARMSNLLVREVVFSMRHLQQQRKVSTAADGTGTATGAGPLVLLFLYQSRGWPSVVAGWGVWDMVLLHGKNQFKVSWLHFTGWAIYDAQESHGISVIDSKFYFGVLLSMLVVGLVTSLKRTALALYFGRRQMAEFKPRMQKILQDAVLLTEIGILADDAAVMDDKQCLEYVSKELSRFPLEMDVDFSSDSSLEVSVAPTRDGPQRDLPHQKDLNSRRGMTGMPPRTSMGELCIKSELEAWEEPLNKLDRTKAFDAATFDDVLMFRRALAFMEDTHPFGVPFGRVGDRDECLASAHSVYWRLLKLVPGDSEWIPFDVLSLVAVDENGAEDMAQKKALRSIFHPGQDNRVTLLSFTRACDNVYKRLRYFRASVGNSSVIDKELEKMFNCIFGFLLILLILAILRVNPWAILVPLSSLAVSASFAIGESISNFVEGLALIAFRRPYDLGDRVVILEAQDTQDAQDIVNPGAGKGLIVEDINIYTTTLRNAMTNEVSTVHNWSIAGARIVNCNRSPNAACFFQTKLHVSILSGSKLQEFEAALEEYIQRHSLSWKAMSLCRHDCFDADTDMVTFSFRFQHSVSWQETSQILQDQASLLRFMFETANKLGVHFEPPPA